MYATMYIACPRFIIVLMYNEGNQFGDTTIQGNVPL